MGEKELLVQNKQEQIEFIESKFQLGRTVTQLHDMMNEVTKEEITSKTVNAACNCVQQLNNTIDMAIKAAKFLSER